MASNEETFVCAICLDFESDVNPDWFVTTPNGHVFHFNYCINEWISRGRTRCPLCEEALDTSKMTRLFGVDPSKRSDNIAGDGVKTSYLNRASSGESGYRDLVLAARKPDYTFKVVLLGDSGVGKSSLLHRYTTGAFNYSVNTTVGCDVCFRTIKVGDEIVKLSLWDTGGQERFHAITKNFVRNANGVVLVYSYADRNSLAAIPRWLQFCRDNGLPGAAHLLVGNKIDILEEQRVYSTRHGQKLATKLGLSFFETSALDHVNIDAVFRALVVEILQANEEQKLASRGSNQNDLGSLQLHDTQMQLVHVPKDQKSSSSCC